MERKIISVGGSGPQVGKSELCRLIQEESGNAQILEWADALKDELAEMVYRLTGNRPTRAEIEREKSTLYGVGLQFLGEYRRQKYGADYWVKEWEYAAEDRVIVPGTRYPNEVDYVKDHGGFLVYVEGPQRTLDARSKDHPCEAHGAYVREQSDLIVRNNGTLDDLRTAARLVLVLAGWTTQGAD